MFSLFNAVKSSTPLALLAVVLAGCNNKQPEPPDPSITPTTQATPTQYGTPFASVPNREDAVIYQVNIRAFSQAGNLAGVTARLDSIKDVGINVVYLMPIYPVGTVKSVNSPYCVKDFSTVGAEYGTLADLRALVDGAHTRGLSVMLDWVPNQTSYDHPWIANHPDWYLRDAAGNILPPPGTTFTDVAQLDFTNQAMRLSLISAMKSWVYTANVDGFRCDYGDNQPADFWKQATDTLRRISTHKLLLLNEGTRASNFTSGFDYNFGFGFYRQLKRVYGSGDAATSLDALNTSEYTGASTTQQVVRYTTNHDVNDSDGTPIALFGGDAGAMSAFVVASCYKGIPFVYNGQEAGMTTQIKFPFTSTKVKWGVRHDVKVAFNKLLTARAASPALQHGDPTSYSTTDVCAFTKDYGSDQALVLANVRNATVQYSVPAALAGTTWTDVLQGGTLTLNGTVNLPAYGYLVLRK